MNIPDGRRRRACFRLLTAALVSATCLLALEGFVRVFPLVLPAWYRSTFPLAGIELFHRGILAETPINGVPIPYRFGAPDDYHGGAPFDLQAMGLAGENPDLERYPDVHFHYDRWGLTNPRDLESADVLLVGDSFTGAMGALSPPGLQATLRQSTGLTMFNLGIPAIGPQREAWLLDNLGLARDPKAVIWFFFGGNDLADAAAVARHQSRGALTYGDLFSDFSWPRSLLLDLVGKTAARHRLPEQGMPEKTTTPVPGFSFPASGGDRSLWFHPRYLRELTRTRDQLEADPGWGITTRVLTRVAAGLARRSIRLLVVYLPSKPQVYLPWVRQDKALALRMASFGSRTAVADSADDFWRPATENRGNLDALLNQFCETRGIDFISLTEPLTDLARRGELGYFAADTHWNEVGQGAAVKPLTRWLSSRSTEPR